MTRSSNAINDEAAFWVVRHQGGPLTGDERLQFASWLASDPRREGAFVRLKAVDADLGRLAALSAGKRNEWDMPSRARSWSRLSRRWAIAAAIATIAAGSGAWFASRFAGEEYVSGVGELRQVSLADGSKMTLNTATETRVRFSEAAREIQLTRGEAWFEVAKDSSRPFVVHAADTTVTAVGTAFTVRLDQERIDVTVMEGIVQIARAGVVSGPEARRLSANQRATIKVGTSLDVEPVQDAELERRLAWRRGMVLFNGESLADAVAEINRHNRRRIIIVDPLLAARPVVGTFRANDIETFAQTAAAVVDARAVEDGDVIRLETRPIE